MAGTVATVAAIAPAIMAKISLARAACCGSLVR